MRNKTLQADVVKRLQPWLDFAGLLSFAEEIPVPSQASAEFEAHVFEIGAAPRRIGDESPNWHAEKFPASLLFPFAVIFDLASGARQFYELFYGVRSLLLRLIYLGEHLAAIKNSVTPGSFMGTALYSSAFAFVSTEHAHIGDDRRISFLGDSCWELFKRSLEGIQVDRLKRCPVCGRVYYAMRANKGACDEHLNRAAVWRARGKISAYESNRQINRLVRQGVSIGEAIKAKRQGERNGRPRG